MWFSWEREALEAGKLSGGGGQRSGCRWVLPWGGEGPQVAWQVDGREPSEGGLRLRWWAGGGGI